MKIIGMVTRLFVAGVACAASACSSVSPSPSAESIGQASQAVTSCGATGWTVVPSPNVGPQDNVLGGVSGSAPNDVWAVGQYVQDSQPDFQQTLVQHFDGSAWSVVPSPNVGSQANTLYSVTTAGRGAWATGYFIGGALSPQSLIETWNGHAWVVVDHPHVGESDWLYSVSALSKSDVWAVGSSREEDGIFHTLIEHFDGDSWSVVPSPNPATRGNQLYGVVARATNDVFAVGSQVGDANPDHGLIVHWDGSAWSTVPSPADGQSSVLLHGVSGAVGGKLHAVGGAASNVSGARAVTEVGSGADWDLQKAASVGTGDNYLYSVAAASDDTEWAVGTFLDPVSGNNFTLIEHETASGWVRAESPNPSTAGSNILGSVAQVAEHDVWAVGTFDGANARQTLILHHCL